LPERVFSLGRECTLDIEGEVIDGIADVSIREGTDTIDATGFGHTTASEIAIVRSRQLIVAFKELRQARLLWNQRLEVAGDFSLPRVFQVLVEGGVIQISSFFTMADIDEDQPIDSGVAAAIQFNEWGHA
jgi:hypothetical protein